MCGITVALGAKHFWKQAVEQTELRESSRAEWQGGLDQRRCLSLLLSCPLGEEKVLLSHSERQAGF